jgi:hypothetical protein
VGAHLAQLALSARSLSLTHTCSDTPRRLLQDFMCRSVTLAGGLLLLIWSENDRQQRNEDIGLPRAVEGASADRLQLSGRLLLCSLFFFQASVCPASATYNLPLGGASPPEGRRAAPAPPGAPNIKARRPLRCWRPPLGSQGRAVPSPAAL